MKFTQEIKDKWLEALKSGDYIQGRGILVVTKNDIYNISGKTEHCCIGVLGHIHPELQNDQKLSNTSLDPYCYLVNNIGDYLTTNLIENNDSREYWNSELSEKQEYSNVIPLIEKLEVKEI